MENYVIIFEMKPILILLRVQFFIYFTFCLFIFTKPVFSKSLLGMDSSKPTVCTVTINSSEEKEVFESYLGEAFNFVELTNLEQLKASETLTNSNDLNSYLDVAEGIFTERVIKNKEDWFLEACQLGIECDILVISGHFGGSFFGSSGYSLSLSELQRRSCQESCSGILRKPKEVFLFGCNTTAGKTSDHRSPEEYTRVLIEDGFSRRQAEQISAFRYSPIGEKTKDRMRQVFPHSRIYGFHSLAPSGKNIRPRLKRYFESVSDYKSHLLKFPTDEENVLWSRAMKGQWIRSVDGSGGIENPMCVLEKEEPLYKKLLWVGEVLSDDERSLSYIPMIDFYFRDLERRFGEDWEFFPGEEQSLLERIQFNEEGRYRVDELLGRPIEGVISAQVEVLNFGRRVGWYDDEAYNERLKILIGDIFAENLDLEDKDFICSLRVVLDISLEDLPEENWNKDTIKAIGCIKPSDERIHKELGRILQDKTENIELRQDVAWTLGILISLSPEVIQSLLSVLQDKTENIRLREDVAGALGRQGISSPEVIQSLLSVLQDETENIRLRQDVAVALRRQGFLSPEVINGLNHYYREMNQ